MCNRCLRPRCLHSPPTGGTQQISPEHERISFLLLLLLLFRFLSTEHGGNSLIRPNSAMPEAWNRALLDVSNLYFDIPSTSPDCHRWYFHHWMKHITFSFPLLPLEITLKTPKEDPARLVQCS
ncbi:hypothetical protein LX32DRAFT_294629 [Colletotrichum zoysiae]|uniref:Uncharacterized protein n=1 Tax=Colletotrichum zoysiae TaxID=1216348 RepID=A0AAD9H2T8_9PEZI|nr:hypothetical protein LX32DRAFT_294629 [Colletotrichum zoysiae]